MPRGRYLPLKNRGIPVPKEPTTIGGLLRRRRLELRLRQSETARRLKVSTVTLSKWECDLIYPTWEYQPGIAGFLGFDPFTEPALGGRKGNETIGVAVLSVDSPPNLGQRIVKRAFELRKTRKEFAEELGVDPKTVHSWATNRKQPNAATRKRIEQSLRASDSNPSERN